MNSNNEGRMTASHSRKRPRSQDQEPDSCAPLSKRINSLHIRCSRCSVDEASATRDSQSQYNNNISVTGNPHCSSCNAAASQLAEYSHQGSSTENNLQSPANGVWINQSSSTYSNCDPHLVNQNYPPEQTNDLNYAMPNLQQQQQQNLCNQEEQFQPTNEDLNGYHPELNEKENPYYFHINKLLYDAHVQKVRRHKEEDSL